MTTMRSKKDHAHLIHVSVLRAVQERTGQPDASIEGGAQESHRTVDVIVDAQHFASLFESVTQIDEIVLGAREPSRGFHLHAIGVTNIRKATGLCQAKCATLIDVQVVAA